MREIKQTTKSAWLLCMGLLGVSPAWSFTFDPGVGVGFEYTDNARLDADNEEDDLILLGFVGASLDASSGSLQATGNASLVYQDFTDNTFSDKFYWNSDLTLGFESIKNRLNWVAQNRFAQRKVDTDANNTPSNTQDTNVFSFGPILVWPMTGRQTLTLNPTYRNFYYETTNADNEQYALAANWAYNVRPTFQFGLSASVTQSEYDNEQSNPDRLSSTVQFVSSGTRSRSRYIFSAGATNVKRDNFENQSGFAGSADWAQNLTGISDIRLYLATSLTDASNDAYQSGINPIQGNVDNVQVNGDVFRDQLGRVEYTRNSPALKSKLWVEARDLDYKESLLDRTVYEFGLDLARPVTARAQAGLYASYNRTERNDVSLTDDIYTTGGDLRYQLARKMNAVFNLQYRTRDSDLASDDYQEVSAFIGIVYGYGNLARTRPSSTAQ